MVNLSRSRLPSLAHPVYVASKGECSTKADRRRLGVRAFPEIASGWPGFHLATLNCIGYNKDVSGVGEITRSTSFGHEEVGHFTTSWTYEPSTMRFITHILWDAISIMAVAPDDHLIVPLGENDHNSTLGRVIEWLSRRLASLFIRSATVEEVYAVWISLYRLVRSGLLSEEDRNEYERFYRKAYGACMPDFPGLYDLFRPVADQIGGHASLTLVCGALNTHVPREALRFFIPRARTVFRKGNGFTFRDATTLIHKFYKDKQPWDDSPDFVELEMLRECDEVYRKEFDWTKASMRTLHWADIPRKPWPCIFDTNGLYFTSWSGGTSHRPPQALTAWHIRSIVNESVRQQLTTGEGVACPFWIQEEFRCRVDRNINDCLIRQFLARILMSTRKRKGWDGRWDAQGCL